MHANMPQTTDFTSRGLYSAYSLSLALPLNAMSLASFCVDKHGSTYSFLVIVQNSSVWMCHNILISIAGHMSNFRVVIKCMLLLLLSRFSRVRLCETPQMAAHQAPPYLGFSRQEHWSGFPFPSPMHESEKWKVKVKLLSSVRLLVTPRTAAHQAPPSVWFSRQEYWSAVPLPSPELHNHIIELIIRFTTEVCCLTYKYVLFERTY